ncbi:MAG: Tat pathway signal sequence domain protein, partial [Opitutus sp.]
MKLVACRQFRKVVAVAAGLILVLARSYGATSDSVAVNWLDGASPAAPQSVSWGVPWPKGKLQTTDSISARTNDGKAVPIQTWTMATWPDGSIKWSGHAMVAEADTRGPIELAIGTSEPVPDPVRVVETVDGITIDTGGLSCRIRRSGTFLFEALSMGERVVARDARLIASLENREEFEAAGVLRYEPFTSRVRSAVVEQSGPVRAVVRLEGVHASTTGTREFLPFTVRLYFHRGKAPMRIVHSFVFDGDGARDFIKGLGVAFTIPFAEEVHNRHLRLGGEDDGLWAQPVQMLPGYRPQAGREIAALYEAHLAGRRVPNRTSLTPQAAAALQTVPLWSDAKLTQLGANNFTISKRTDAASASWLHVTDGRRAHGFALLGDVSGGIAVGLKHFWQKHPASIELLGGARRAGEMRVWLWSPDAPAMDLRRYDDKPHGLSINYEDWKPGWGEAYGIANTAD